MVDMVQKDMSGDAPRWKRSSNSVPWYTSTNIARNFARSKLTMDAIRSMRADFYDLPDDTRDRASANTPKKMTSLEEEVTIDDSEQSLQTISPNENLTNLHEISKDIVRTSANSSNQKIKLVEKVTIDYSEQSQQTISQILNVEPNASTRRSYSRLTTKFLQTG
jgi:hypothetical protein